MSLLTNITPDQVAAHPFPHVLVENALDENLCRRLTREFPPLETFTEGRPVRSNQKIIYTGARALSNPEISALWKSFIQEHLQPSMWVELLRIFGPHLLRAYPDFEERFGKPYELRSGVRNIDDYRDCDLLLDAELVIQTPVAGQPSAERGPHLKIRSKPFLGFLYLRPDEDDSHGADHVLYSIKPGSPRVFDEVQSLEPELLTVEKVIPYRSNTLVLFLNTPESIQGLGARSVAGSPLMMFHFLAQMREPLFSIESRPSAVKSGLVRTWARRAGLGGVMHGVRRLAGRLKSQA